MRGAFPSGGRSERRRSAGLPLLALAVFFLFPPAAVLSSNASAQSVRAHISADSVKIGERFRLSLVADHNFLLETRFPTARADSDAVGTFGDLVVLGLRDSTQRYLGQAGMRRDSMVYEVTTFALDTARVAPLPVLFVQSGRDTVRVSTREHLLPVTSVLPPDVRAGRDSAALRPLAPPSEFPRPLWPWLLGAIGLAALAALLAYLWWNRDEERETEPASKRTPVPPADAARRRLRRLEETTAFDDPDTADSFYTDLSHALRRYLMQRLGLRTFRSTTGELVAQLRRRTGAGALPAETPDHVRRALEGADLAKFADQRPPAEIRRSALAEAFAAIDAVENALRPEPKREASEQEGSEREGSESETPEPPEAEEEPRPPEPPPENDESEPR